ncbi:MAG: alpha-glucan family phosphorylase [Leadbetterella sp.]|nr:alpha-glucan family phosphorylase [Leadbetterella sp.]
MTDFRKFTLPYTPAEEYSKSVAYFSMEFAIDQPLKIYSGGLGFLAGSHMRSAWKLRQNLVGIGILWKYGYYDQARNRDQTLHPTWTEKMYNFLEDTGIRFQIDIHRSPVWVKALYLRPEVFGTVPMFFLSTDVPENDYLAQTTCHYLYDPNPQTKLAQYILLGKGGAKLLDEIGLERDVYHLNEAHGLPAAFYLLEKLKSAKKVKQKLVFTTHTPEEAGNEKHDFSMCYDMSYFGGVAEEEVREVSGIHPGEPFNHSLCALRMARIANGVSRLHGEVSREMWGKYTGICKITSITNAQEFDYWADKKLYEEPKAYAARKKELKAEGFRTVADQTGKILDPEVLTIVWARRFAAYKRPDLLLWDFEKFLKLVNNTRSPVQLIWAGKPYPHDYSAISTFNYLVNVSKSFPNMAVVTGYELALSRTLKNVSDVWLNTPRVPREASGTSGMTAAMAGAVNLSTDDGWIPEFAQNGKNAFVIPQADYKNLSTEEQDRHDIRHLYDLLENSILPTYYEKPEAWIKIARKGMEDVKKTFNSDRMAREYYQLLYNAKK